MDTDYTEQMSSHSSCNENSDEKIAENCKETNNQKCDEQEVTGDPNINEENTGSDNQKEAVQAREEHDPFYYTKREEFTSEIFKIEIMNLPRFGFKELKKRLAKLEVMPVKVKALPRKSFAFATFRNEEEREDAMLKIQGHVWRDHKLSVKKASAMADPLLKKRKQEQESDGRPLEKKSKVTEIDEDSNLPPEVRLKNAVTPLWNVPYEEQLERKTSKINDLMKKYANQIFKNNTGMRNWLQQQRNMYNGHCCELLPIKPSVSTQARFPSNPQPVQSGYRNKCEFTIGKDIFGNDKVVGFRFGQYRRGTSSVGEPDQLTNIPDSMKKVTKSFQEYLHTSKYGAFNPETHDGHWRMLTVRTSRDHGIMVIADFHPQNLSEEVVVQEKQALYDYFTSGPGTSCHVTSLFFHVYSDRMTGNTSVPYTHVSGKTFIEEELLGLKFRISPDAFFQVNTAAAEVLYQQIGDWCHASASTTVLDICCGTGTIGLTLAKRVSKVIGIEMCQQAVDDAKQNAKMNGVDNVEYHCGKAEDLIRDILRSIRSKDVVAVVDPPRAGLYPGVIQALRKSPYLSKLVYVSCNPNAAVHGNFIDLIRQASRKTKGQPFQPVKAIPIDLFPQTEHCELVVLFERELQDLDVQPEVDVQPEIDIQPGIDGQPGTEVQPKQDKEDTESKEENSKIT